MAPVSYTHLLNETTALVQVTDYVTHVLFWSNNLYLHDRLHQNWTSLRKSYQGVVSASTGHIATHESGAVEACGHKVLTLPSHNGKIDAAELSRFLVDYDQDANHDHIVMPGMVYISHPTEYGTLYSHSELEEISRICRQHHIPLYLDGARLAYALACPQNDLSLQDLAALCDVFYIGGTKCGALFGEAVVITVSGLIPHFFTIIKPVSYTHLCILHTTDLQSIFRMVPY